jgi:ribonuclease P protein component
MILFIVAKQYTLGKNERLKSRKQIELLFSEGKKFVVAPFRIFYLFENSPATNNSKNILQFGAGVSAKHFKKAVDRNRIKRLTREAYRVQKNELTEKLKLSGGQLNIFFIYTSKEMPEYNLVKDKLALALKKLENLVDENPAANT